MENALIYENYFMVSAAAVTQVIREKVRKYKHPVVQR